MNKTKENLDPLNLQIKSSFNNSFNDCQSQEIALQFEYKLLQLYGPLLGIYAIPNLQNFKIWNCIIFIRQGFFKDGKFKFDIEYHNFPKQCPKIHFKSKIFHPLINLETGQIDIGAVLNDQWNYFKENMLYNIFNSIKSILVDKQMLEIRNSFNPEAYKILKEKPHLFIEKSLKSVEQSLENLYHNQVGTSLIIKKYQNGELDPIKQKLQQIVQENKRPQQKRKNLLKIINDY